VLCRTLNTPLLFKAVYSNGVWLARMHCRWQIHVPRLCSVLILLGFEKIECLGVYTMNIYVATAAPFTFFFFNTLQHSIRWFLLTLFCVGFRDLNSSLWKLLSTQGPIPAHQQHTNRQIFISRLYLMHRIDFKHHSSSVATKWCLKKELNNCRKLGGV